MRDKNLILQVAHIIYKFRLAFGLDINLYKSLAYRNKKLLFKFHRKITCNQYGEVRKIFNRTRLNFSCL